MINASTQSRVGKLSMDLVNAQNNNEGKTTGQADSELIEGEDPDDPDFCSRIRPPVRFDAKKSFFALSIITLIRITTFWQ